MQKPRITNTGVYVPSLGKVVPWIRPKKNSFSWKRGVHKLVLLRLVSRSPGQQFRSSEIASSAGISPDQVRNIARFVESELKKHGIHCPKRTAGGANFVKHSEKVRAAIESGFLSVSSAGAKAAPTNVNAILQRNGLGALPPSAINWHINRLRHLQKESAKPVPA